MWEVGSTIWIWSTVSDKLIIVSLSAASPRDAIGSRIAGATWIFDSASTLVDTLAADSRVAALDKSPARPVLSVIGAHHVCQVCVVAGRVACGVSARYATLK